MNRKVRVAVFISGGGTNLQSLIDACSMEDYPAEIVLVVSSSKTAYGLERAKSHSIPTAVIRKKDHPSSDEYAEALLKTVNKHNAELICLAGYLKLIPSNVVTSFRGRILNIHPALLPKFGGKGMYGIRVHEAVIAAGESESGPTIHFVDEVYDHGSIFMQRKVPVLQGDTPEVLQKRVLAEEHKIYPDALRRVAEKIISEE